MFKIDITRSGQRRGIMFRLTVEEHELLKELAKENKMPVSEIVRQMIDHCLNELNDK